MDEILAKQPTSDLAINQAGYGAHPLGVVLAVVSVGLAQALVTAQSRIGILDDNPTAREGRIVGNVLGRTWLAAGLFVRAVAENVQLGNTLVATVPHAAHALRQAIQ